MGQHFKLISDDLVKPLADELQGPRCDGCGQVRPQFFLFGPLWYMTLGLRGDLMPSAIAKYRMDRVCLECLKAEFGRGTFSRWTAGVQGLRSPGRFDALWPIRRMVLARDFARTPPYPSFQEGVDWPVCCRHCCEFRGWPADGERLQELVRSARYWCRGPQDQPPFGDDVHTEDPRTDVNIFGCPSCGKTYFTRQIS